MIGVAVLGAIVLVACVVLSRFSAVGSTALDPPPPSPAESSDGSGWVFTWKVLGPFAVVGAAGSLGIVASTLLADPLALPQGVLVAVLAPSIPLLVMAIVAIQQIRREGRDVLETIESAERIALPLAGALFVLCAVIAFTGFGGPGDVRARDGRYISVSHGVETEITHDEYVREAAAQRRRTAAFLGALYAPAVALGLSAYGSRRARASFLAEAAGEPDDEEGGEEPSGGGGQPEDDA